MMVELYNRFTGKMILIDPVIDDAFCAEAVHQRVQEVLAADELHSHPLGVNHHAKVTLSVIGQVESSKRFVTITRLARWYYILHTVHAPRAKAFAVVSQKVIISIVYHQSVWADGDRFLRCADSRWLHHALDIHELNLFGDMRIVHGFVAHGVFQLLNVVQHGFVGGFYAVRLERLICDLVPLMLTGMLTNHVIDKLIGLALGQEAGGVNAFSQEAQIHQLILAPTYIKAALSPAEIFISDNLFFRVAVD